MPNHLQIFPYKFVWKLRDILVYSEPVKWAVQNAVGLIIPMLFVLIKKISFSSACSATVFYGVTSQAFSIDRTTGGRWFGGLAFLGVIFTGGTLGFGVVSLSWLARGASVPREGLAGLSPESGGDVELSSAYWILLMVLHVIVYLFLTYVQAITDGLDLIYAKVCQSFVSALTLTGMGLMPSLGETQFWTRVFSPMIKNAGVTMLAMVVNSMFLYVKSSHDTVREQIGDICVEIGRILSLYSSIMHHATISNGGLERYFSWSHNKQGVKHSIRIVSMSLDARATNGVSIFEPAWPFVCSQVGTDRAKYAAVISKVQVFLGSLESLEILYADMMKDFMEEIPQSMVEREILRVASRVLATIAAIVAKLEAPLKQMPLWGHCQGDDLVWRPHSKTFWNNQIRIISDCVGTSLGPLREITLAEMTDTVENGPQSSHMKGEAVGFLVAVETLLDECIEIETAVANALEIKEVSIPSHVEEDGKPVQDSEAFPNVRGCTNMLHSPYTSAVIVDTYEASGLHIFMMILKAIPQGVREVISVFAGSYAQSESTASFVTDSHRKRQHRVYCKSFLAHNLATIAIILIGWFAYANTDNYITNATNLSNWYSKWQPQYFVLTTAVCMQETVDAGVLKAIMRVSLIALGGSLGYASVLNGTLAQNGYYMFFLSLAVNGFFGLFAFVSLDFRYALFLCLYTWNAIAICTYTGTCCAAGSVYKFGGKTASTAIGAVYAFIVSNVVFPEYASRVAFEYEGSLLMSYVDALKACYWRGTHLFSTNKEDLGKAAKSPTLAETLNDQQKDENVLRNYIEESTKKRLKIVSNLIQEVENKSLDSFFVLLVKITLIPLPACLPLIFRKIAEIGSLTNTSVKVLRSSLLRGSCGQMSAITMAELLEKTDASMNASIHVAHALIRFLVTKNVKNRDIQNIEMRIADLDACGEAVRLEYQKKALPLILSSEEWTHGDLRFFVWYNLIIKAMSQINNLGHSIINDPRYRDKGGLWSLPVITLPSKSTHHD